ncbi:MAK10-like protein [Tanacetum coccineum]
MGDENPIRTLGDYSKPSHEGYRNTIELLVGNNVVPLRSDTIRLVQNGCSFHGLRYEDPNQHLKDFLKLVDSFDLDGENRERTRLRTAKLRNDILMFQQHHGESLSEAWTRFKDLLQKVPHHGIDLWLQLRDLNPKESWAILQDLALYDNESWNDPRDFAKPVKAITLAQDVPSTSDRRLIELENQVQRLMEAYLASTQLTQVNKITASCEICNGPHDTHNYMEGPEQSCVDYASSHANEISGKSYQINLEKALLDLDSNQEKRLSHLRTQLEQQQDNMIGKINLLWKTVSEKLNDASPLENAGNSMAPKIIVAIRHDEKEELKKKGIKSPSKLLSPKYLSLASIKELNKNPSSPKCVHFVNSIIILSTDSDTEEEDDSSTNACDLNLGSMVKGKEEVKKKGKEEDKMEADMEVEEVIKEEESEFKTDEEVKEIFEEEEEDEDDENFNSFLTMKELSHHEWLLKNPRPLWVKAKVRARSPNNIKISCMVGHFFKRHTYIDLESPINIMSMRQYNQIMTYGLRSRPKPSNPNKISNFVGRIRGLNIFIGSFAYECDFMILEDTTSIIDHHLREMVFGRPFIKETSLVYNKGEGTVMFEQNDKKISFKMPHTMEIFRQTKLMGLSTDSIPSFFHEENFGHGRTHYYQSLLIGDEYKQDESDKKGIRHLMRYRIFTKGRKTKPKTTKSSTERKSVKRQRQIKAKVNPEKSKDKPTLAIPRVLIGQGNSRARIYVLGQQAE